MGTSTQKSPQVEVYPYDPYFKPASNFTPALYLRIRRFARVILDRDDDEAYARHILARVAFGDPEISVWLGVRDKKLVAHMVLVVIVQNDMKKVLVEQLEASGLAVGAVDKMVLYADNWCRSMNISILRSEHQTHLKAVPRLASRLGYKIVTIITERQVG